MTPLILHSVALAGKKDTKLNLAPDPAANASEIPALARLLEKTGWTPTPEMSGAFRAGYIFQITDLGHRLQTDDCFAVTPTRSTYTAAEIVTQLQAGVSVAVGLGEVGAGGSIAKKMKFGAPEQWTLPELKMVPTDACVALLIRASAGGVDLSKLYVVQDVLTAEIAEQTCGQIDAGGRFVAVGSLDASLAMACAQESLEPVAIAYRTRSVSSLPEIASALQRATPAPAPALVSAPSTGPSPALSVSSPAPVPSPVPVASPAPSGRVAVQSWGIEIHEKIVFSTSKAVIEPQSYPLLDEIARLISDHPEITHLRVEGHTDDVGDDSANLALSQARAEAVVQYLVRAGVSQARLSAKGYGETKPIASNSTPDGRASNRRVDFFIERAP